ncbi:6-phosphogluconolactonase [Pseudomonas fluvialis]|uniref:6-phosphogluconolactonase n=1 Tax=Pseudomonas fluvialis TaxID=1793966 RepID=A0A7X0BS90_9PSED|nr:6-phosphogluconolactonase [Pseudomonas fluvialis]MBB6341922.1 6-phosphogluconolactonase [Pseudomonas fluvialis]
MTLHWKSFDSREACLQALAEDLAEQLQAREQPSLLLPGGSSPQALLPLLAAMPLDWSRVRASPSDERWVPAGDAASNLRLLSAGLPEAQWLDPRQGSTPEQAARHWGGQLQSWLPLTAVLLGMGEDGHFASLFPGTPGLAEALDGAAEPAALPAQAPSEPRLRLTPNLALLLRSDWLGLLVFGSAKRALLEQAQKGQGDWPVRQLLESGVVQVYWAE